MLLLDTNGYRESSPSQFRNPGLLLLAALALLAAPVAEAKTADQWEWDTSHAGQALDLGHYRQTFFDDFNAMSITSADGDGPWYAAVHKQFGSGAFLPVGPQGTYQAGNGLKIRAEKVNGKWQTGLIQTVDKQGRGFAQQYGYFEMKAKFPGGIGSWPGFWLLSQNGLVDRTKTRAEVDIIEWYGSDPTNHHACLHLRQQQPVSPWARAKPPSRHKAKVTSLGPALVNGRLQGLHTYGAEVTPDWIIIYFDRHELERIKTLPEYKTPLYMLVDLAISKKEDQESPKEMVIDHVAAYAPEVQFPVSRS